MARFALCLEQTLGHRAHTANIRAALNEGGARADLHLVEYQEGSRRRAPWAVEASWRACSGLRSSGRRYDAHFFHTQSVSLFAPAAAPGTPFVVSVDATPLQVDAMARWYGHSRSNRLAESAKRCWYRQVFRSADALVAWSGWAAESLVRDYGARGDRIMVAHPGAGPAFFELERQPNARIPTVLFVGGDFARKGGDDLLDSFRSLRGRARLLLVTAQAPRDLPVGVEVLCDATPGSAALLQAFARSDIFCLPTRGDCTPVAIEEAMAAGLSVVATRIGSNAETIQDGVDGILVQPGDRTGLAAALARLVDDVPLRETMGAAARQRAHDLLDAHRNAGRIVKLLEQVSA